MKKIILVLMFLMLTVVVFTEEPQSFVIDIRVDSQDVEFIFKLGAVEERINITYSNPNFFFELFKEKMKMTQIEDIDIFSVSSPDGRTQMLHFMEEDGQTSLTLEGPDIFFFKDDYIKNKVIIEVSKGTKINIFKDDDKIFSENINADGVFVIGCE